MKTADPTPQPKTLTEAIRYFADPDVALRTMVELRWPDGVRCPPCGSGEVRVISTRRLWECKHKHPRRQFSAKVGTIFEDSPLDLGKWFAAIWMVANCKNGISSYEMHRALGVTQKTAWFMDHRIRLAMKTGSFNERKDVDGGRFCTVVSQVAGKRLTYKELIGDDGAHTTH